MAEPHALSHEISTFLYIYIYIYVYIDSHPIEWKWHPRKGSTGHPFLGGNVKCIYFGKRARDRDHRLLNYIVKGNEPSFDTNKRY